VTAREKKKKKGDSGLLMRGQATSEREREGGAKRGLREGCEVAIKSRERGGGATRKDSVS
jgi:hypothetical protein